MDVSRDWERDAGIPDRIRAAVLAFLRAFDESCANQLGAQSVIDSARDIQNAFLSLGVDEDAVESIGEVIGHLRQMISSVGKSESAWTDGAKQIETLAAGLLVAIPRRDNAP